MLSCEAVTRGLNDDTGTRQAAVGLPDRGAIMFEFRRQRGDGRWHFCNNCSAWPDDDFESRYGSQVPKSDDVCWECHGLDRGNGNCQYEIREDREAAG
jgi:hypothetical protein